MKLHHETLSTPFGRFSFAVDDRKRLVASAFGGAGALRNRIAKLFGTAPSLVKDATRTNDVRRQVLAYARGAGRAFTLPLAGTGTPFQRRVWRELASIPFGTTRSYGEIARKLGTSARAVGGANARNPICLIVPCHRVIGANGSLTGFAFGESVKQRLLAHERRLERRRRMEPRRTPSATKSAGATRERGRTTPASRGSHRSTRS